MDRPEWLAAPQRLCHLHAALQLARTLERRDVLPAAFSGICMNVLTNGRIAEALGWANQCLAHAQDTDDQDLLIVAHENSLVVRFWLGDLLIAREHGEQVVALCGPEQAVRIATLTNHDPVTIVGIYASQWTWMLGFPNAAVKISEEKDEHARQRAHPFDLCFALGLGALVFDYRGESQRLLQHTAECRQIAEETGLPFMERWHAPLMELLGLMHGADRKLGVATLESMVEH